MTDNYPHDPNAEKTLIGCCLMDRVALVTIVSRIVADDFHIPANKIIYSAIVELFSDGESVDYVTVTQIIMRDDNSNAIGGVESLAGYTNVVPSVRNAERYCSIVRELGQLRRLISFGSEIQSKGIEKKTPVKELVNNAMSDLVSIADRSDNFSSIKSFDEILEERDQYYQDVADGKLPPPLKTGFSRYDNLVAMMEGDLVVLGAYTSNGKTAFSISLAVELINRGESVLFISSEMTDRQLLHRFASNVASVDSDVLRRGDVTRLRNNYAIQEFNMSAKKNLKIAYVPAPTELDIGTIVKAEMIRSPKSIVIVDYLQHIFPDGVGARYPRHLQVGIITRYLKAIAGRSKIPILLLSQLSRPDKASVDYNEEPTLGKLKESGDIENNADSVVFLHRQTDDFYQSQWDMNIIVAKNRLGKVGRFPMVFKKAYSRFEEDNYPGGGLY